MSGRTLTRLLIRLGWTSGTLFLAIGIWDFLIAGAYKLIVLGAFTAMLTGLLARTLRRGDPQEYGHHGQSLETQASGTD